MLRNLLFTALFFAQFAFSQGIQNHFLQNIYADYFELERESVFVHTNKTAYLPGETVWFTAHFYDRHNDLPLLNNTNLHCTLFGSSGQKITSAVLSVENGIASGNFKIPKDVKGQKIFLKSETAWMQNFTEDDANVVTLQLTQGAESDLEREQKTRKKDWITVMPEGGYLVSNISNTVGLIVHAQTGIKNINVLEDRNTAILSNISVNDTGIGKFEFIPLEDKNYFIEVVFVDGTAKKSALPKAKTTGVALSTNSLFPDKVVLELKTNTHTLEQIAGQDYFVAIHRDGVLALKVLKMAQNYQSVSIPKNKLRPGMNIITIFDQDLNPILERLVFNDAQLKVAETNVENMKDEATRDSIKLKIQLYSKTHPGARMSVSVLPKGTTSMNPKHSVLTQFLIAPYLKNSTADFKKYLDNLEDRVMQYQLDNVLLTHGWSRYDWSNVFINPPEVLFEAGHGFSISGEIESSSTIKNQQLLLYQKSKTNIYQTTVEDSQFVFDNTLVNKDEPIYITLLNNQNKTQEPRFSASVNPLQFEFDESLSENFWKEVELSFEDWDDYRTALEPINTASFFLEPNTIALKGVTVTEEKIENKLVHRPAQASSALFDAVKVTDEIVKKAPTVQQLLQSLSYRTLTTSDGQPIILSQTSKPGVGPPVIVVDNITVFNPSRGISNMPPNLLNSLTLGIDEIYYTHQPIETGNRPVIYIYRKDRSYTNEKSVERFAKFIANEGFQRPEQYVNPEYVSYTDDRFQAHGTLHWANEVSTNSEGEAFLTIPTFQQEGAAIYIEGIAEDGSLISEVKSVSFQ